MNAKNRLRRPRIVAIPLLLLVLMLAACGSQTPAVADGPDATTVPPAVASDQEADTADSTPPGNAESEPQDVAPVAVAASGVQMTYPASLAPPDAVTVQEAIARVEDVGRPPIVLHALPPDRVFTMSAPWGGGTIRVRALRDETGAFYAGLPQEMRGFYERLATQVAEQSGPSLIAGAGVQTAYFPFQNGTGVRQVAIQSEGPGPFLITDDALFYLYQGLTADGRFHVDARFDINAAVLPDDETAIEPEVRDGLQYGGDLDFGTYYQEAVQQVGALSPDAFAPGLETLDAVVQSLVVGAPDDATAANLETIAAQTVSRLETLAILQHQDSIRDVEFSADGSVLATASGNQGFFAVRLWQPASGDMQHELLGHTGIVWDIAISPAGDRLISTSDDGTTRLWNLRDGTPLQTLEQSGYSVAYAPSASQFAVGGLIEWPDGAWWLFDAGSGERLRQTDVPQTVNTLDFSPEGSLIAGGGTDRMVRLWRPQTGELFQTLSHPGQVTEVAFSPHGSIVATGLCAQSGESGTCAEGDAFLWRTGDGVLLHQLEGHTDWVDAVAFSPDGSLLATGSRDSTIRFWSVADGTHLYTLANNYAVTALAFSPDGRLLVSGSSPPNDWPDSVRIWGIPRDGSGADGATASAGSAAAVAAAPTATPAASVAAAPAATTTSTPAHSYLIVSTGDSKLNVSAGPGGVYDVIGQLDPGADTRILGTANVGDGDWWQIAFAAVPTGVGWVSADPAFVTATVQQAMVQVNAPPTPTPADVDPTPLPTATAEPPTATAVPAASVPCTNSMEFIGDETLPDGSVLEPDATVTKMWRIKNTGTCTWTRDYLFTFGTDSTGFMFGSARWTLDADVRPGQEFVVSKNLYVPATLPVGVDPNDVHGRWDFQTPGGDHLGWVGVRLRVPAAGAGCLDQGEFVTDASYPDGTTVRPGEQFIKTWRIKNTGPCTWSSYEFLFRSDSPHRDSFGVESFQIGSVAPGQEYDFAVELTAPSTTGRAVGRWVLESPHRSDGYLLWVGIDLEVR